MLIFTNEKIEIVLCKDQVISGPPDYTQLANQERFMFDVMPVKNVPKGIRTVHVHLWKMTETSQLKIGRSPYILQDAFKGVRGWQFLAMKAAETLCIVCLPPEKYTL